MSEGILGNATGGFGFPKTYIITDNNGNELTGVYVESETVFTATDNDVREGMVYASDGGVSIGKKNIPVYQTLEGVTVILAGRNVSLTNIIDCDYTKLQVIICVFNSSFSNSVAAEFVVINDKVYRVNSAEPIADVTIDVENNTINFGFANEGDKPYVLRYFSYKEEL